MLVNTPSNKTPTNTVRLELVKAGKLVELQSPDGNPAYYMICRSTEVESIKLKRDRVMLANLATGRIVFKLNHLPVFEVSCETATHYLETQVLSTEQEEAYENRGNR